MSSMMIAATTRSGTRLRHLSSVAASTYNIAPPSSPAASTSSATTPQPSQTIPLAPSSSSTTSATTSLPPWLHRALRLWDQESGTHEILQLKQKVNSSSLAFDAKQRQVAAARSSLDSALQAFEESQTQHNQLLQSRDKWGASQAMEFAKLLEKEVQIRNELERAKKELATLENEQTLTLNNYMNDLRRRYQEEQLWQERWRIFSTYGTWGLIVLNSIVFLLSQYRLQARETRRMQEMKGLLEQSLMVHEGTFRAIRERQSQNSQQLIGETFVPEEGVMYHKQDGGTGDEHAKEEDQSYVAIENEGDTAQNSTQLGEGNSQVDKSAPQSTQNGSLSLHWTRRIRHYATNNIPIPNEAIPRYWSRSRQYVTNVSNNLLLEKERRIDVPSAVIGASATGVAWLAAAMLSRKG